MDYLNDIDLNSDEDILAQIANEMTTENNIIDTAYELAEDSFNNNTKDYCDSINLLDDLISKSNISYARFKRGIILVAQNNFSIDNKLGISISNDLAKIHEDIAVENLAPINDFFDLNDRTIYYLLDRLIKGMSHARYASVAAIMSRSMSHNIGSHVISRINYDDVVNKLKNIPEDIPESNRNEINLFIFKKILRDFHDYLQEKNDFIAEISTEPFLSPNTAYFYQDIICRFNSNVLLLENIAKNEGLAYEDIEIKVRVNETEISMTKFVCPLNPSSHAISSEKRPFWSYCPNCIKDGRGEDSCLTPKIISNLDSDILVELPGSLGTFAIYNILEAVIRNACKHNIDKLSAMQKRQLIINIRLSECSDNEILFKCSIWDNLSQQDAVDRINTYIDSSIVEYNSGEIIRQNWGIAEMKICASLLRNWTFDQMEEAPKEVLKAIPIEGHLGYEFYILKARRSILISDQINWDDLGGQI